MLGHPIAHSLSPVLHRAAYAELGLDWDYTAVDVTSDGLAGFLGGLDASWRGLSLTMPLKRTVVPLLDEASDLVRASGVANTVVVGEGGLHGHNTDVPGAVAALRERSDAVPRRVLVLGGGATATSLLLAAARLGCTSAVVMVREPARAEPTVAALARLPEAPEVRVLRIGDDPGPVDLACSTIPADAQSPELVAVATAAPVVFDVVYDPWPTPLAATAAEAGRTVVSGLELLVHQAADQVRLMTGVDVVPLDAMRAAGERALDVTR